MIRSVVAATIVVTALLSTAGVATAQQAATTGQPPAKIQELKNYFAYDRYSCESTRRDYQRYYEILTDCFHGRLGTKLGWMFFYEG